MKHLSALLTLVFIGCLVGMIGWYAYPLIQQHYHILSPLPDFLTITKNSQASTLALFFPHIVETAPVKPLADFTSLSVLAYDVTRGQTLYAKAPQVRLPMASLTKIMTAIIAIENPRDDDSYSVAKNALVGEDSMGLSAGETLSLEDILYGLMLPSGNDAAEVLARNYPYGGRDAFVTAMNNKSRALGLVDTHFTNPSGLQGDGNQFTTVSDLLVITRYALNYALFKTIVATEEHDISQTATHKAYTLYNETNLLTTYPGVKGVKTGYTPEAGYCLVTLFSDKGYEIIGILLGSQNRREEMKELLDYSLTSQGITPPPHL